MKKKQDQEPENSTRKLGKNKSGKGIQNIQNRGGRGKQPQNNTAH